MNFHLSSIGLATLIATTASLAIGEAAHAVALAPDYTSFESSSVISSGSIFARITKGTSQGVSEDSVGGAFSEFSNLSGLVEVNFNDLSVSGQKQFTSNGLSFTAEKTFGDKGTNVLNQNGNNNWAPSNIDGSKNKSEYLGVFNGNKVTVSLGQTMNYFGINWGALSANNTFILLRENQEVGRFSYRELFPVLEADHKAQKDNTVKAKHQNQYNSYLHFYADSAAGLFDTLVLEQTSTNGGGFEVDNFSYIAGDSKFDWQDSESVPEPGVTLGLLAISGIAVFKRRATQACE